VRTMGWAVAVAGGTTPRLCDHVVGVVLLGAQKQVLGIYTARVVAAMEDVEVFGAGSHVQLIGHPARHIKLWPSPPLT
jgi:hypothetical protein